MFAKLYLKNFRNLSDESISFRTRRGTVKSAIFFYGENGVGKSSVLYALGLLKQTIDGYLFNIRLEESNQDHPPFILKDIIKGHFRIQGTENMKLIYELVVEKDLYIYTLEFNTQGIRVHESLIRKYRGTLYVLYASHNQSLYINERFITEPIRGFIYNQYQYFCNDYTILSVFNYLLRTKVCSLRKPLDHLIQKISRCHVQHNQLNHQSHYNIVDQRDLHPSYGTCTADFRHFLDASAIVISQIAKSLFPNIDHVKFIYETAPKIIKYRLVTYIKTPNGTQVAQNGQLPQSYHNLLHFTNTILDAYLGNTVIYDDINALFSSETIRLLITGLIQRTQCQFFFSFNSIELLSFTDPHFSYIFVKNDDLVSVKCINELEIIRDSHNILKRYKQGHFNHYVPSALNPNLFKILVWFEQYANTFRRRSGL